ncbi:MULTISPECIES: ABC transporter substrate-binding protein [Sphingobium]|jgi:iron complex transport system substrate-binding protein|uniref:ABC transporter substrate-binding protein n=1 Tax=Sphingobium TaxID=165695 RepID=UPI000E71E9EE|nr:MULTISPECIES: ABC transporter substrate-binding protein [Sphingobium]KAA9016179.1 ABC transporter substrate-binding protein [Sphingobium limneticum]MBU0933481.1 ABC transporter substrate-binding protein [Alphaproteobacteria bacterium]
MIGRMILAATALFALSGAAAPPRRIVSLNVCADQYLLALADPGQIAALSSNARDPTLSAAADKARGFRILRRPSEEVLAIQPDLILGYPIGPDKVAGAPPGDWRTLGLASAESYGAILDQIRQVARAIGHADRGEALIAGMNRDLATLPHIGRDKVAAYYQRRGYMTGTGTLIDDLMHRVGLTNLASRLGKPMLAQISLEEMVAARPDWLIVESATDRVVDQGTEMLHHPALRTIPRISLPQSWTVCGGPAYVQAARAITARLNAPR